MEVVEEFESRPRKAVFCGRKGSRNPGMEIVFQLFIQTQALRCTMSVVYNSRGVDCAAFLPAVAVAALVWDEMLDSTDDVSN